MNFSRGAGGVQNAFGNSGGVGVYFYFKTWKFQRGCRVLSEIIAVVGVWIFFGTSHSSRQFCD